MFIQVERSRFSREGGERESRRHTYRKGKERKEETGLWKVTTETIIKGWIEQNKVTNKTM